MKDSFLAANRSIFFIVGIYLAVSFLWIWASDWVIYWITDDPVVLHHLSLGKGWFFIIVSAGVLYGLIYRYSNLIRQNELLLKQQNMELTQIARERTFQLSLKQQREQELLESEERFQRAILYAPLPVMIHAEDGEVLMISKTWTELSGYTFAEIPTTEDWLSKAYPNGDRQVRSVVEKLYELNERLEDGEFKIHTSSGQVRSWAFSSAPLGRLSDGRRAVISMAKDVTEHRKLENELRERNRELDQFAYVVSHDLKAPLRAIDSLSSWIAEDLEQQLSPEVAEHITLMRKRVRRLQDMIQGLLDYSRIGRVQKLLSDCAVEELLEEILEDLALPTGFTVRIKEGMPFLYTEKLRLRQVFSNLIDNAVKHHDKQTGHIEISVEDKGDYYAFSVEDDGPGISAAYHTKIFELFQVLQPRDVKENTGVGLALVKKIVETQGGQIQVASEVGRGTTFLFTWPK